MVNCIPITAEQLAQALGLLGGFRTGFSFFPYRIIRSSFTPPEQFFVMVNDTPLDKPLEPSSTKREIGEGEKFSFTKNEIAHALTMEINVFGRNEKYLGNQVVGLPDFIQENNEVEFEYVPKGASKQNSLPHFGGL